MDLSPSALIIRFPAAQWRDGVLQEEAANVSASTRTL